MKSSKPDPDIRQHLLALATEMFEDKEAAENWLHQPLPGLGGLSPLEFARREGGPQEVERLIGRLRHGIVS